MPNIIVKSEEHRQQEEIIKCSFVPPEKLSRAEINEAAAVIAARTREAYQKVGGNND